MKTDEPMEPSEIIKRPYARVLTPEPDGRYTAEIMEFPGCVAYGDTSGDALKNLDEVAVDWIAASLEQGQSIPEPMANVEYSGRLVVRMTKGLHQRAAMCAEREGVSLNQFIVTCLAEAVGERARPRVTFQPYVHAVANFSVQIAGPSRALSGTKSFGAIEFDTTRPAGNEFVVTPPIRERQVQHAGD
jgi:antitoxin HicB